MIPEEIKSIDDAQRFVEGCLNDYEAGILTKEEVVQEMGKYTNRIIEIIENREK